MSAVEILCKKNPLNKDEIMKISEKWEKRTAKAGTKWPKEGTFDMVVCEEMEVMMKNHKLNKTGKKVIEKREREGIILAMFKKEGENWRRKEKTEREMFNRGKKLEPLPPKVQPPPYNTGLYPLVSGTVDIKGEVVMDKGNRDRGPKLGPHIHMDCYRGVKGAMPEWEGNSDSDEEEVGCSQEEVPPGGKRSLLVGEPQKEIRKSRRKKEAPKSHLGEFPILVRGEQAHYVPWGSQDLEGLISRLPNINSGASKWIRMFEEYTVGKLLAVGDLKALLARVLGISKMEGVLQNGGLMHLLDDGLDGTTFDTYRSNTWAALRSEYPTHVDHKSLRGPTIGDTENPASFLQKQVMRWRLETDRDPEQDPLVSILFRTSIIETLPSSIQNKLEDVVGLISSKSHKEFSDHLVHAVDRYRQNEQKMQEQSREVQRKLSQLQLEELTRKDKDKKKQAVVAEPGTMTPVVQRAPPQMNFSQVPPQAPSPLVQQPQSQGSPAPPIVNVYTQNREQGISKGNRQKNQYRGPQGQPGYGQRQEPPNQFGMPRPCWECGQEDHFKRDCPRLFYPPGQQQRQREQGQRRQETHSQYRAGPWMGQGY